MRDQKLVSALRCVSTAGGPIGDCKKCPFYKTEPVPEDLAGKVNLTEWSSCDVDAVGLAAADRIANQSTHIAALQQEIEKLRGQLKAYEDTKLTPEEVSALVKDWSDLRTIVGECGGIDRVRKLAEADRAGRLVVLPSDKALTNADRIRAATNQQLAKLLYDNQKEFCRIMYKNLGFEDELDFSEDYSDILAWLNAPSKEAKRALEAMKDE